MPVPKGYTLDAPTPVSSLPKGYVLDQSSADAASDTAPSAPQSPLITAGEGQYQMKDKDGKMRPVSYSHVVTALQQGYRFADQKISDTYDRDAAADPRNQTGSLRATPSIYSREGIEERLMSLMLRASEYLPSIGGTAGGLVGGVGGAETGPGDIVAATAGAAAGGDLGEIAKEKIQEELGWADRPTGKQELKNLAEEAAIQGGAELTGRVGGKVVDKTLGQFLKKSEPLVISGETIPQTTGQVAGKPGGLTQTLEHYLSGTWMSPLRKVRQAQQQAAQTIVAKLSGASTASAEDVVRSWEDGAEETRAIADPLYQKLEPIPSPASRSAARDILDDSTLKLDTAAKKALTSASGAGHETPAMKLADQTVQNLGYRNFQEALEKEPDAVKKWLPADVLAEVMAGGKTTIKDALNARSVLGKLANRTADPNERRLLWGAADQLNEAIDKDLTNPEDRAAKAEADKFWRRSRIMDKVAENLQQAARHQDPNAATKLDTDAFVKMVNDLAHSKPHREIVDGVVKLTRNPSELDALFEDPKDRKAMIDLASFLQSKHRTLAGTGGSGLSEQMARLGAAMAVPTLVGTALYGMVSGKEKAEEYGGSSLLGLYVLTSVLAHPNGARLVLRMIRGGARYGVPAALRIIDIARQDHIGAKANQPTDESEQDIDKQVQQQEQMVNQ